MNPEDSSFLSVVIIALNEELALPRCLDSLPNGCEIVVLDSGSTDATKEVASHFGAKVHERAFDHYASQKNAALDLATKPWVLSLDADEVLNLELRDFLAKLPANPGASRAYRIPRKLVFMNRLMRFGKTEDRPIRLFTRGCARFEGVVHEKLVLDEGCSLRSVHVGHLAHYSYSDLEDYFSKFNRYTSKIAQKRQVRPRPAFLMSRAVLRPWWEFISRYFLRLGFLDGYPGYCYALLSGFYGFAKYAKLIEAFEEQTHDPK